MKYSINFNKKSHHHMCEVKSNPQGLKIIIEIVLSGDISVVLRPDLLGIKTEDLISAVNRLNERGVTF